ncbi:MAG: ribonuclease D [Mycobacterium kyogaense]|uniref:ribonuclease D n=1 Tax=Mycobacterium kyogaense TaxID=2212479 RepID=UPI002FF78651
MAEPDTSGSPPDAEHSDDVETPEISATPLLVPRDGVPNISVSRSEIARAADLLASGSGAFAVDAERASGFRYSNRAYLVQIRRAGAGTVLIDPVSHGGDSVEVLAPVAQVLSEDQWILHAADQDLPCLAEIGMRPPSLYDTELAGRLADLDRVNLASMVQQLLGLALTKGHGAADWSKRPLPDEWLNYAALDVEVLIELRDAIDAVLTAEGKDGWAREEFEYLRIAESTPTRRDRWRRTSGIHKVRDPRALAAVRELWLTRDQIARRRDIAPGRILPDSAIVNAATADPDTVEKLTALPIFGGARQRRSASVWLDALARARTADPPSSQEPSSGPPPASRWARRKPEAAARLEAARAAINELAQQVSVPPENLLAPDTVRRLCWDWVAVNDTTAAVEAFLDTTSARRWQRELTTPVLTAALESAPSD